MPKQNLAGRKLPRRRRLLDPQLAGGQSSQNDLASLTTPDQDKKGGSSSYGGSQANSKLPQLDDDLAHDHNRCYNEEVFFKRFPERIAYICDQVEQEMKEEEDPHCWSTRAWTYWFYFQYFLELEWERFTPLYKPLFVAALVHHAIATLEVFDVCIGQINTINLDEDLLLCKKRDPETKTCLIMGEVVADRDVKRLEIYFFTVKALYYTAHLLPFAVPLVYFICSRREKDPKVKYDERTFMASQLIAIVVTLFVCLMPFLLAVHSEIVNKIIVDKGGEIDFFGMQNNAIWIIHGNMFRLMWLFFFRLMAIDMTLFQFFDWFFDQFEEEELSAEMEEIQQFEKLQEELKTAKGERKKEIEKRMLEHALSKTMQEPSTQAASAEPAQMAASKPPLQLPIRTTATTK